MEIYSNTTRFALACNMSNKIIEPIQSRCAILRYAKLRDAEVLKRLKEICEAEEVGFPSHSTIRAKGHACYRLASGEGAMPHWRSILTAALLGT